MTKKEMNEKLFIIYRAMNSKCPKNNMSCPDDEILNQYGKHYHMCTRCYLYHMENVKS